MGWYEERAESKVLEAAGNVAAGDDADHVRIASSVRTSSALLQLAYVGFLRGTLNVALRQLRTAKLLVLNTVAELECKRLNSRGRQSCP